MAGDRAACDESVARHDVVDLPRLEGAWKLPSLLAVSSPGRRCRPDWRSLQQVTNLMRQIVQSCEGASRVASGRALTPLI